MLLAQGQLPTGAVPLYVTMTGWGCVRVPGDGWAGEVDNEIARLQQYKLARKLTEREAARTQAAAAGNLTVCVSQRPPFGLALVRARHPCRAD